MKVGVKVVVREGVEHALYVMVGVVERVTVRDTVGVVDPPPKLTAAVALECLEGEEGGEEVGLITLKVANKTAGVKVGCTAVAVFPPPPPPEVGVWLREGLMEGVPVEEGLRLEELHFEKVGRGEDVRVELPHLLTLAVAQLLAIAV